MINRRTAYSIAATMGIVLIAGGLVMAALGNPKRFSLDPRFDNHIHLLTAAGFLCTLAGIGLLLPSVAHTTRRMSHDRRKKINIGVGAAIVLQIAAFFLWDRAQSPAGMVGILLILLSLPVLMWACVNYAKGKGYSAWVGLLGVAGIPGLLVLTVLPDQHVSITEPNARVDQEREAVDQEQKHDSGLS